MKRIAIIIGILLLGVSIGSGLCAQDQKDPLVSSGLETEASQNSPVGKLQRGVVNAAGCWAEIPATVAKVSNEKDPLLGATLGVVEGTVRAFVRLASGVFDTITFPSGPYDQTVLKPENPIAYADNKIKEYLW